jgi:nitrogenase molybdenum-iron protein NifN
LKESTVSKVVLPHKALTVNPLKVSQSMGASLAFLGISRCVPLEHGAQGCTAFSKVFFTRHFREPIPLQTTAMDHMVTVMGADANVIEALRTVAELSRPQVIGLVTTGLTEIQDADIVRTVREFRAAYPQHDPVAVVPVNAPDTVGCLESGFALAVEAAIAALVPESRHPGRHPRQVNVLASSALTPGDVEAIGEWIAAFGLQPLILPDLGDSLDGHLDPLGYTTLTAGGTPRSRIATMGASVATLVIGSSLDRAADLLKARTGVPDYRFPGLMGLEAADAFTAALGAIAGRPVPRRLERQRAQLLDAMVDCHFQFGGVRVAVAADPELLGTLARFFAGLGIEPVAAVASARRDGLADLPVESVVVGDLDDLENAARAAGADLLVANSHAAEAARRLGLPLLRAGFPLHDRFGGFADRWVGYAGSRRVIFEAANLLTGQRREIAPYRSIYWQGTLRAAEVSGDGTAACLH